MTPHTNMGIPQALLEHPSVQGDIAIASVTGSRLYGIANDESDWDYIIVSPTARKNKKIMADEVDANVWTVETYIKNILKGVPQAYEIQHSPYAMYGTQGWEEYLKRLTPSPYMLRYRLLSLKNTQSIEKQRKHNMRTAIMSLKICAGQVVSPRLTSLESQAVLNGAHHLTWAGSVRGLAKTTTIGENQLGRLEAMLKYIAAQHSPSATVL